MIVHSREFVTALDDKCMQPNAVDLRIASLDLLDAWAESGDHCAIFLGEKEKQFFQRHEVPAVCHDQRDNEISTVEYFELKPGKTYSFTTMHDVEVPEGIAGIVKVRSTLARNGLIVTTGLYDSGYNGPIGGMIFNSAPATVFLEQYSRIAQFITFKAETTHLYDGHWNHNATR